MAGLIRQFDWSTTDLGPADTWPKHVCAAVELIVQSPVPMILLCGPSGVMIYNDGYSEIAGLRHPSILGGRVRDGWPEIAEFNSNVLRVCLGGGTLTYHDQRLTLLRNNVPEEAWFDIYYSPIYGRNGEPDIVLAVIQETTAKVLMEQQRNRAEEALQSSNLALQQANSDLEQFAFSASHDLKEPLRTVSVCSQLLKLRLGDDLDSESEDLLNCCAEGVTRLDELIKDLLEYTRSSADSNSDPEPVSLDTVVASTLNSLQVRIQETGAAITVGQLPTLRAHFVHLQQIFQNLIGNALTYRSKRRAEIQVAAQCQDGTWIMSVTDNGIGIDPAYKEQVFGLFKRLHSSSEYPGTGLGLAICKKLVERYRGQIWLESRPGEGTTFYFTLPLAEQ